ncbi:MAG: hypothetical protein AAF996_03175 [Pseudomonadota bacterium]
MSMYITAWGDGHPRIGIAFERGESAFDSGQISLEPGQCTWLDRSMRPDEPTSMSHKTDVTLSIKISSQDGRVIELRSHASPNAQAAADMRRFLNTYQNQEYFSVDVRLSNQKEVFEITRFH